MTANASVAPAEPTSTKPLLQNLRPGLFLETTEPVGRGSTISRLIQIVDSAKERKRILRGRVLKHDYADEQRDQELFIDIDGNRILTIDGLAYPITRILDRRNLEDDKRVRELLEEEFDRRDYAIGELERALEMLKGARRTLCSWYGHEVSRCHPDRTR